MCGHIMSTIYIWSMFILVDFVVRFKNYIVLMGAFLQINASSTEDGLNFYDSGHRFEHSQLLLVLLRSLPFASKNLQSRALQV